MSVLQSENRSRPTVPYTESQAITWVAADRRADGASRKVSIGRAHVLIERKLAGIAMRIGVATSAYRGIALSLGTTRSGASLYRVSLTHRDPDLSVDLYSAQHDRDIVAQWGAWAAYFALPKLVEREPGRFETAEKQLGAVALGKGRKLRRRGATLSKRRPRIGLRRRVPRRPVPQLVQNEREIICYE